MRIYLSALMLILPLGWAHAEPLVPSPSDRPANGASLTDPNLSPHVLEQRTGSVQGRHELTLYPVVYQANPRFTQHIGTELSYLYHLNENFGIQLRGQYNWSTTNSHLTDELITKLREGPQAASALLLQWGALAGVELTPIYGKFAFYNGTLARFSLVFSAGAGVGSTRHQLRPAVQGSDATYGDTGMKMLGSIGAGFRVQLGEKFLLRLEVHDLVYTAKVDRVNGCTAADLSALNDRVLAGQGFEGVALGSACRVSRFSGTDGSGNRRDLDVPVALGLVRNASSDVLNNIGIYAGIGYVF